MKMWLIKFGIILKNVFFPCFVLRRFFQSSILHFAFLYFISPDVILLLSRSSSVRYRLRYFTRVLHYDGRDEG